MASYNHSPLLCNNTVTQLLTKFSSSLVNVTRDDLQNLMHFCVMGYESLANEKFSEPLVWIGVYIAIASLFCTVAMGADIFYRLFVKDIVPGKYFSLNAASITVISIAMKLSLDMTGSMPGVLDQVAKLGGLAFMCTMMANLIPSLASMDNKALVENIIGLAILVITIIGNISVEIYTGVIGDHMSSRFRTILVTMAFWYVAMMLLLLLVSISTAIIIPHTKKILEYKYQAKRNRYLSGQSEKTLSEEELKRIVTKYWIMAKSGSPHFVMARTSLAYTSTLICVINAGLFCALFFGTLNGNFRSDYGLAIRIILVIQFVGIIIGTLALVSRCLTSLSFRDYENTTPPEGYSANSLSERKRSCIAFLSSASRTRAFVRRMEYFIISLCIGLHVAVFASCGITGSWFEYYYIKFTTSKDEKDLNNKPNPGGAGGNKEDEKDLNNKPNPGGAEENIEDEEDLNNNKPNPNPNPAGAEENIEDKKDLRNNKPNPAGAEKNIKDEKVLRKYVLYTEDLMHISQRALKGLCNSMENLIKKQQNDDLEDLLDESGLLDIRRVSFDIYRVPDLASIYMLDSWSLPVVTLTGIAIHVPGISAHKIANLIYDVDKALGYTHLVEESFKRANEYENILNTATTTMWYELKENPYWCLNPLNPMRKCQHWDKKKPREILVWFQTAGRNRVPRDMRHDPEAAPQDMHHDSEAMPQNMRQDEVATYFQHFPDYTVIAAHSMQHISSKILTKYGDIAKNDRLFEILHTMIADILCACLTNIPQVIMRKCHSDAIEKREASVEAAVKLFGRTGKIRKSVAKYASLLPEDMNPKQRASIDEWRKHFP